MKNLTVALAGNPNAGKSTIFNALTGDHQHVGNWAGKTVEQKTGFFAYNEAKITVIDLPGTYSLSAFSPEEQIARDFIVKAKPEVVVNILDASNIERNLYLTAQILEIDVPLIIVLNMNDLAQERGFQIDIQRLSTRLGGIPVISMIARRSEGLEALKQAIVNLALVQRKPYVHSCPFASPNCPSCRI